MSDSPDLNQLACPLPLPHQETIVLGHGSGGKLTHDLIRQVFLPFFDNPILGAGDDGARANLAGGELVLATDAHVVSPLFFPGGDIGRLAVCGTVNDVAMMGAEPKYLTASFIIEEGLSIQVLAKVAASMQQAAHQAGVLLVAGDTKVVQKGKADQLFISTTGAGEPFPGVRLSGRFAQPGDLILLSGAIGEHGIAVLQARGELGFQSNILSDVAPLNHLVKAMLQASQEIHVLRDPTRGGLATTLCEIAIQSKVGLRIDETAIPISGEVAAVCEMLGFDPLYVANEGKLIAFVAKESAPAVLQAMRGQSVGAAAAIIGEVVATPPGRVLLQTALGTTRVVDMLAGEMLPRIC